MEKLAIIISALTPIVAGIGIFIAYKEYQRQGRVKSLEMAIKLRNQFMQYFENLELISMLAEDDPRLDDIPLQVRSQMIGHLELVEFLIRQKSMDEDVAFNFFGYYAIYMRDAENFIGRFSIDNSIFWEVYQSFVNRMSLFIEEKNKLKRVINK